VVVAVATNGSPLVIADEQSTLVDAAATSLSSSSLPSFCAQSEQQQWLQATAGLGSDCLFFSATAPAPTAMSEVRASRDLNDRQQVRLFSFGQRLGGATKEMKCSMEEFISWLESQTFTHNQLLQAQEKFKEGVLDVSGRSERAGRDLWTSVLEVIKNPGWVWMSPVPKTNRVKNLKRPPIVDQFVTIGASSPSSNASRHQKCAYCTQTGVVVKCSSDHCGTLFHLKCAAYSVKHGGKVQSNCQICAAKLSRARVKQSQKRSKNITENKILSSNASCSNADKSSGSKNHKRIDVGDNSQLPPSSAPSSAGAAPEIEASASGPAVRLRQVTEIGNPVAPSKVPQATANIEQFQWSTAPCDTEFCLSTLECLSMGKEITNEEELQSECLRLMHNRCVALCNFYKNNSFLKLSELAKAALGSYGGKQEPVPMEALEAQLRKVGFALTPRMWTKTELSLIMVVLLDPHLKYMSINQKQGDEVLQNRYEYAPIARIRMSVHHGKLNAKRACASVYTLAQSTLHAHKRQCTPWHTHCCTHMRA